MYPRKIPLPTWNYNLRIYSTAEINNLKIANITKYLSMFRQISYSEAFKNIAEAKSKLTYFLRKGKLYQTFENNTKSFKNQSSYILKLWAQQCECVLAQRLRRGQQMFSLYSKLWEEKAFKDLMKRFHNKMTKRGKDFMVGAISYVSFNWDKERIAEDEMRTHMDEFKYTYKLKENTLCKNCQPKPPTSEKSADNGCNCDHEHYTPNTEATFDNWETFIEKKDLVVWRRLHRESGHYEYKVYGSYPDVTAEEFLNVQFDTNYRRIWDTTAIVLEVVEKDPKSEMNSDIIYWEMLWPMLFANRDYVFKRRYLVDYSAKTIIMSNKSTTHQKCQEKSDKVRVKDYWSTMVIRPYKEMNQYGIEFVLTYYDNPGVSIPPKVTTWVAMRAMPDYLERLREATKKYNAYLKKYGVKSICQFKQVIVTPEPKLTSNRFSYLLEPDEDLVTDNTIYEAQHNIRHYHKKESEPPKPKPQVPSSDKSHSSSSRNNNNNNSKEINSNEDYDDHSSTPTVQKGTRKFWRYLYPTYYIS